MLMTENIEQVLQKSAKKSKTLQFAMHLPESGTRYSFSSTKPDQRFHSASVGKLMTSTLIFMAIEQGKLSLDAKVAGILKIGMLDKLFVFEDVDHQGEVTIRQLLGHTSGVNDYFGSKTFDGSSFTEEMIRNPDTFWTPDMMLDYTRENQKALSRPGEKFFYSDTGYVLLGLVIEEVFTMPFHQALETYLFKTAGMKDTHLCFYSEGFDQKALGPTYINGVDVHLFRSLSADFSGGGLSTTTEDLLKFLEALQNGKFISQSSLDLASSFTQRYRQGLHYGLGMMQIRFEEFFFMLKHLPRVQGHLGVTAVHAWYDPKSKGMFVLNVGDTKEMASSFRLLIKILEIVYR